MEALPAKMVRYMKLECVIPARSDFMVMLNELLRQVDQRKAELDTFRPLPPLTASSLREKLALDWTYHSNAIEGNTLSLRETKVVLEDGITIGKKSMREHFEAINHRDAILFVGDLVSKDADVDEWDIKNIHQLVYKNIDNDVAGRYRNENVVITGAGFIPPDYLHVQEKMTGLVHWLHKDAQHLHPIDRAAQLHTRFVEIHPFQDGNGRTARLLLNLELMREGYPVAIIRKEDRLEYYNALDKSCVDREYGDFTRMVAESVARSLDLYLEVITGKKQEPLVLNDSIQQNQDGDDDGYCMRP
ncbi:Fic family protein [Candidatus Methylospira mobilis]|uniref:Fic family protein n=1 Tax=Candidatus Methylospira mobilis TaxID=1808979 RepID=UPI0028E4FDA7|nr:Fic family protein [Candidatus Methylospira mobilis]WNV05901.1 Fic family protein [Candidatus Methylospira mobilis]